MDVRVAISKQQTQAAQGLFPFGGVLLRLHQRFFSLGKFDANPGKLLLAGGLISSETTDCLLRTPRVIMIAAIAEQPVAIEEFLAGLPSDAAVLVGQPAGLSIGR